MTVLFFGLCYLGGDADLFKLRTRLLAAYPGTALALVRGRNVMTVPLAEGAIDRNGVAVRYLALCHQFDSGFGTLVYRVDLADDEPQPVCAAREIIGDAVFTMASVGYVNRVFGVDTAGDLFTRLRQPDRQKIYRSERGIDILPLGLDNISIGINDFDCFWTVGGEPHRTGIAAWRDLSGGARALLASDNNRFWSPAYGDEFYWDLVAILQREHMAVYCRDFAKAWLGAIMQQLRQSRDNLLQDNEALWDQDRADIERVDLNHLAFTIYLRYHLTDQEHLHRRDTGPASLRVVEPVDWEGLSRYRNQMALVNNLVAEGKDAIGRMARPLDVRQFKLLKDGVEEVEARIMLLTVLLVIMELFAQVLEPGHWHLKSILLVLLLGIPAAYLIWMRVRRAGLRRKGRTLYLESLKTRAEEEIRDVEQKIANITTGGDLIPETRDHYLWMYEDIVKRLRQRTAEYDTELEKHV